MSSWNNRIFKHENGLYAMHEAHYNKAGKVWGWTEKPMTDMYNSVDDLIKGLRLLIVDAKRFQEEVLNYDDPPEGKPDFNID